MNDFGPWFTAQFDSECDDCGEDIEEGDQIRADGEGGYLCEECGQDEEDDLLDEINGR